MKQVFQHSPQEPYEELSQCEECGGDLIKTNSNLTCSKCGLVNILTFEDVLLKISARDDDEKGAFSYYGEREYIVDGMGSFIDYYGTNNLRDAKGKIKTDSENCFWF